PRVKESPYSWTAIGAVIEANGGTFPTTGSELTWLLQELGTPVQLSFPFSGVALDSGLSHPRVVLTLAPALTGEPTPFPPQGGWGGGAKAGSGWKGGRGPLPRVPSNKTLLEGRLFFAANMEVAGPGENPRVKTVEFISWNTRRQKFDFGVIEDMGTVPQLKFL